MLYTFEARIARRWRDRRVFLAGDAAHTMPPYLGQGACSGIRDSANLAWKLDLVLRGLACDSLLDSYELERRPHTAVITQMAMTGAIANMHNPGAAAQRDAAFAARQAPPPPAMPTVSDGILHRQPDGTCYPAGRRTGASGPRQRGERRGRLDDIVHSRLRAHHSPSMLPRPCRTSSGASSARSAATWSVSAADVIDTDGVHTAYLRELGAVGYLARPDFVLFGAAADPAGLPVRWLTS